MVENHNHDDAAGSGEILRISESGQRSLEGQQCCKTEHVGSHHRRIFVLGFLIAIMVCLIGYFYWFKPHLFAKREVARFRDAQLLVNDTSAIVFLQLYDEQTWLKVEQHADTASLSEACKQAEIYCRTDSISSESSTWSFSKILLAKVNAERGNWREADTRRYLFLPNGYSPLQFKKVEAMANQGNRFYMGLMGRFCEAGLGVPRNYDMAIQWFKKAADLDDTDAQYELGMLYAHGGSISMNWRSHTNYTEAFNWFSKASEHGNSYAQFEIGECYNYGKGVNKDLAEASKWYRKAADAGVGSAQRSLGDLYYSGQGVALNPTEAVSWYRKAAENGNMGGAFKIGWMYDSGQGVGQDYREAFNWYQKVAGRLVEEDDPDGGYIVAAQRNLGLFYLNGTGVTKDYNKAIHLFSQAAQWGDEVSQYNLGLMNEKGWGVNADRAVALKWYRKAAEQGNEEARQRLVELFSASPD